MKVWPVFWCVKDSHDDVVMSGAFAASLRAMTERLPALPLGSTAWMNSGLRYTGNEGRRCRVYVRCRSLDDDPKTSAHKNNTKRRSLTGLLLRTS
ncbi:hypothetical protein KCP77_20690 [Salmonella enterica subsp. enterica]|nr:hypothetical protein KCP77_20690 [Salmonella enterica subsp. enterica]